MRAFCVSLSAAFVLNMPGLATSQVTVSAQCNIYGAGHATAPNPGGAGAGSLPVLVALPPGVSAVRFAGATGSVLYCGSCGPASGADGALFGFSLDSFGGLSGIVSQGRARHLSGVFLGDDEPVDPAPARLVFNDYSFASLSPQLRQGFFVGDGLTGTGTGATQVFVPPAGATRLFLGFYDSANTLPGWYDDNSGSISISVAIETCPGDLNSDGFVDDADFQIFAAAYNILDCADTAMASGCPADLNRDGFVDDADFTVFAAAYNVVFCE